MVEKELDNVKNLSSLTNQREKCTTTVREEIGNLKRIDDDRVDWIKSLYMFKEDLMTESLG